MDFSENHLERWKRNMIEELGCIEDNIKSLKYDELRKNEILRRCILIEMKIRDIVICFE